LKSTETDTEAGLSTGLREISAISAR